MAHRDGLSRKVLLIGWDAADWEHINPLLEEGLLPTLDAFINRGVMGNLATLQPILSPRLWNSVATGKFADKHGIHGFIEPDPANGGARPYTSYARKCKALWNILSQSVCGVMSSDGGRVIRAAPTSNADEVHSHRHRRVHPEATPRCLELDDQLSALILLEHDNSPT
jgi:hypothetical protein